jgi:hypothetical protein
MPPPIIPARFGLRGLGKPRSAARDKGYPPVRAPPWRIAGANPPYIKFAGLIRRTAVKNSLLSEYMKKELKNPTMPILGI